MANTSISRPLPALDFKNDTYPRLTAAYHLSDRISIRSCSHNVEAIHVEPGRAAVSMEADRTGKIYDSKIPPDIEVKTDWALYGTDNDAAITAAIGWLKNQ